MLDGLHTPWWRLLLALTTIVVAALMLLRGIRPDPWTAALVIALLFLLRGLPSRAVGLRRSVAGGRSPTDGLDPDTGAGTAEGALSALDWERHRARTQGTICSVVVVGVETDAFTGLATRQARRATANLVRAVTDDVRIGDRVFRVTTSDREQLVVLLPDTPAMGAATFTTRLVSLVERRLLLDGVDVRGHVRTESMVLPNDGESVRRLERRLRVLEHAEARLALVVPPPEERVASGA